MDGHEHHDKLERLHHKTSQHESEIGQLKNWAQNITTSLHEFQQDVKKNQSEVNNQLRQIVNMIGEKTAPRPTNWYALIGAGVSGVTVVIAFIALIANPIITRLDRQENWISERRTELKQDYERFGQVIAEARTAIEHQKVIEARLFDLACEVARDDGRMEIVIPWLEDVDKLGSRRHVLSAPEAMKKGTQ